MLLIFGIDSKEKRLIEQNILCSACGKYGRLEIFVVYSFFSIFFIPIFKWNRRYYARSSCCNTVYAVKKEAGRGIEKGEYTSLRPEDLEILSKASGRRTCSVCGFIAEDESFLFCPKCGAGLY
ncbi:MAG: hypothetical protein BWY11_02138 [Firmicutes bacterium ADurb.Bin182]|nr:MAG: hypothetical protein BWY11_02138 [Firmicutes bacterium ADurb.Bin182]